MIQSEFRKNQLSTYKNAIVANIRRKIWNQIWLIDDVEFAYSHTEVLLREKSN